MECPTLFQTLASPIAIVIAAGISAFMVMRSIDSSKNANTAAINNTRDIARQTRTIDAILDARRDDKLQQGYKVISQVHDDPDLNIETCAYQKEREKDDNATVMFRSIIYVLNYHETVALAINKDLYDETIMKRSHCDITTNLYSQTHPFIARIRDEKRKDTIFKEFENLAAKWTDDPLTTKDIS